MVGRVVYVYYVGVVGVICRVGVEVYEYYFVYGEEDVLFVVGGRVG